MHDLLWWMSLEDASRVMFWMSCGLIMSALVILAVTLIMPAPYGRYGSASWGMLIDARCGWYCRCLPSLVLPIALCLCSSGAIALPNKLLLGTFIVHYIHR